LILTDQELGI